MSKIIHVDKYGGEVCPECEDAEAERRAAKEGRA